MKHNQMRTFSRMAAVMVAMMMIVCCAWAEETAACAGQARIGTAYPARVVKIGELLTFDL